MNEETIKNLLPKFVDDLKDKGRSPATSVAYKADLEQLANFLISKNIVLPSQVKSDHLESFRDSLLTEKYTPKSVSRKLNAQKSFFRWLLLKEFATYDPSSGVSHPKIKQTAPKFLSQLEYRALRDIARNDARVAAMIELILQTGMRISEIANVKTKNISNGQIKIEAFATQPERTVPLNSSAGEALSGYLAKRPKSDSPYLFISKNGKPLAVRNIRAAIDRYMQKSEISGYSVNDLRTTFIVENLKAEVDLILLSQVSGHKRLSTTERYLELAGIKDPGKKQTLAEL